jgi:hypothetical protein
MRCYNPATSMLTPCQPIHLTTDSIEPWYTCEPLSCSKYSKLWLYEIRLWPQRVKQQKQKNPMRFRNVSHFPTPPSPGCPAPKVLTYSFHPICSFAPCNPTLYVPRSHIHTYKCSICTLRQQFRLQDANKLAAITPTNPEAYLQQV